MRMTKTERATRSVLAEYLRSQGYVTYASLLLKFDLNFYRPAEGDFFAAAMMPTKYTIYINPEIKDKEVLSMLIRHEILHEYLKHYDRELKHLAAKSDLDYDELDDVSLNGIKDELEYTHNIHNIAGDYEISNRGYTENDKEIVRNMGKILGLSDELRGLVTEDDHPEWVNLSIEEMYDLLRDEMEKARKEAEKEAKKNPPMPPMPSMPPGGDPPPMPPMPPGSEGDDLGLDGGSPGSESGNSGDPTPTPSSSGGDSNPGDDEGPDGSGSGPGGGDPGPDGKPSKSEGEHKSPKGGSYKQVVHHGTFIDDHTFVDRDGNAYDLSNPK